MNKEEFQKKMYGGSDSSFGSFISIHNGEVVIKTEDNKQLGKSFKGVICSVRKKLTKWEETSSGNSEITFQTTEMSIYSTHPVANLKGDKKVKKSPKEWRKDIEGIKTSIIAYVINEEGHRYRVNIDKFAIHPDNEKGLFTYLKNFTTQHISSVKTIFSVKEGDEFKGNKTFYFEFDEGEDTPTEFYKKCISLKEEVDKKSRSEIGNTQGENTEDEGDIPF